MSQKIRNPILFYTIVAFAFGLGLYVIYLTGISPKIK